MREWLLLVLTSRDSLQQAQSENKKHNYNNSKTYTLSVGEKDAKAVADGPRRLK